MVYKNNMIDKTETSEKFEPARELHIGKLETLKIVSDALRARLLDLLRAQEQTVKQLAAAVNLPPKKLYYHISLMEQHGLIRTVATRVVSGIIEKSYRATAYLFLFDQEIFTARGSNGELPPLPALALTFATTQHQLEQSVDEGIVDLSENALVYRSLLSAWCMNRLSHQQATAFYTRMRQLLDEFNQGQPATDEAAVARENADEFQDYRLFVTLFPVRAYLKP
jgi:DNA-binding transcriptional ArsR family regulator